LAAPAPIATIAAIMADEEVEKPRKSAQAWSDLALTLPIFVAYHLAVVLLKVRNAADVVTAQLTTLADRHILIYWGITLAIGAGLVAVFALLGKGQVFETHRFVMIALEGIAYAFVMRLCAVRAVGSLPLAAGIDPQTVGIVMSLGAGFYEELVFRVILFGGGVLALKIFFGTLPRMGLTVAWAVVTAVAFSGWHYVGPFGDDWNLRTFVFRAICGLVLTAIFAFRGFAAAVWTHALYDVWALVLAR
jgi:hypothetical protein